MRRIRAACAGAITTATSFCIILPTYGGCSWIGATPTDSASHVVFSDNYTDLGQIFSGAELERELPFRVEGDAAIRIVDVTASCGCATPTIQQCESEGDDLRKPYAIGDEMQPGTLGVVLVRMRTAKELGIKDIRVSIRTDVPSEEVSAFMALKILPAFEAVPGAVVLGNVQQDRGGSSLVVLQSREGRAVNVRELLSDDTRLDVTTDRSGESSAVLKIAARSGCALGRIQARVRVVMEQGQELDIPVEGAVVAE